MSVLRCVTTINTFKPQSVNINLVFVAVVTFVIGNAMALVLPSKGKIGRFINPGPVGSRNQTLIANWLIVCSSTKRSTLPSASCVLLLPLLLKL